MAFRLYIVPAAGSGPLHDPRRPKYLNTFDSFVAAGSSFAPLDYGFEPWFLVGSDLSSSDDNLVVGQADAFALPFDLSVTLNAGQVTAVKNKLEAIHVPALWVNNTFTWLQIVRVVVGMFEFVGKYGEQYAKTNGVPAPSIFAGGVTLATTFGSLPAPVQAAMIAAAQSFGISTAGLTAGATLRVILKALGDNFQNFQHSFGGMLI